MVPRLSETPGILARPAPRIGEHNADILVPILGEAEYARLHDTGVVREPPAEA
jgi:crotonobetainyl-CoA:carnitine CoA-transferase CaiB-like acyl-CoA transferase